MWVDGWRDVRMYDDVCVDVCVCVCLYVCTDECVMYDFV